MTLKDTIGSITGGSITGAEPEDVTASRTPMLDELKRTRELFAQDQRERPRSGWYTVSEDERVAFGPTRPDGQPIVIGGQAITFWSADEFPAVLDAFEAAVRNGELDEQLRSDTPAGHSLPLERLSARID